MSGPVPLGLVDWRLPVSGAGAVTLAASLGVGRLQVDVGGPGRTPVLAPELPALLRACRDHQVGIDAVACNRLNDLGLHGLAHAARVRQTLTEAVHLAHALGAPMILVPGFRLSRIRTAEHLRASSRQLAFACDLAHARGLEVAYESDLDAATTLHLIREVGRRNFTLLLDPGNLAQAGHVLPALLRTLAGHWCPQVHIKGGWPDTAQRRQLLASLQRPAANCCFYLENDYRQGIAHLPADLRQLHALFNHPEID
ncbi:sugar phosphate isomerase/epimerase [Pseudomonas silvicola]|nr:sugar phosphate isomerase/epimerase [Pseudomonas silvicola]